MLHRLVIAAMPLGGLPLPLAALAILAAAATAHDKEAGSKQILFEILDRNSSRSYGRVCGHSCTTDR